MNETPGIDIGNPLFICPVSYQKGGVNILQSLTYWEGGVSEYETRSVLSLISGSPSHHSYFSRQTAEQVGEGRDSPNMVSSYFFTLPFPHIQSQLYTLSGGGCIDTGIFCKRLECIPSGLKRLPIPNYSNTDARPPLLVLLLLLAFCIGIGLQGAWDLKGLTTNSLLGKFYPCPHPPLYRGG